jgi:hypothetical protein
MVRGGDPGSAQPDMCPVPVLSVVSCLEDICAFRRDFAMATVTETPATTSQRRAVDYWIFLGVAIVASIVVRLIVNTKFQAPTILTDELTYSQLARDIADGKFSLSNGYGIVYPLLLAPSWIFNTYGTEAYTWIKATNAVLVSLTAVPVFCWAKRMMQPRYALLAAILTLAMPSMAYSGHVMTENAFLLFFMLAAWAIAVAVERPTILNQVLVVLAVAVAFGTRAQAVALLAALPLIIVLHVLAEERASGAFSLRGCCRRLLRFWPLAAIAGLGVLAVLVRTLTTDWQVSQLLQAYSATTAGQYTFENVSRYFLWHFGEATFALGVIPVAALLLLVGMGILNRTRSSAERAYLATAVVTIPLVILQVATFTSFWSQRVSERNMYCVFPIVLIGLALWLNIKLPRPTRTTALSAAIAGGLALSVPFAFLYQRAPSTETWAIVLPNILTRKLANGADDVYVLIIIGVAVALLAFGILRPRLAVFVLPLLVAGYFTIGEASAVHEVGKAARDYRNAPSLGADASWLDKSVPPRADVALITGSSLGADTDRVIGWETSFFNKTPFTWLNWGTNLVANPLTGAITAPDGSPVTLPPYVITPASNQFMGTTVVSRGSFLLQQPSTPLQAKVITSGIFADNWTGGVATIDVYNASAGTNFHVQLDRSSVPNGVPGAKVNIQLGPLTENADGTFGVGSNPETRQGAIEPNGAFECDIPSPGQPFRVVVTVEPVFNPSAFGQGDTRDLGARIKSSYGSEVIVG